VRFRRIGGYDASEVDELLRRIAVELDAGRPAGPLIVGAAFRQVRTTFPRRQPWAYDYAAVDWFLEQLQRQEDHSALAGMGADPWRDLPVGNYFTRKGPGLVADHPARPSVLERQKQARQDQEYLHQECEDAWRDFGQQPGTRLRSVRTGTMRRELRTAEQHTIASLRTRLPATVSTGGRTFAWKRVTRSSWPGTASSQKPSRTVPVAATLPRRELLDETGTPVLYTSGRNHDHTAWARITFADQRWLQFPVRGTHRFNAIMTAVDQAGNRIARYRVTPSLKASTVEIIVHPSQQLTDELVLAFAISAPWLSSYFKAPNQGGGG
jgi:DivIVA domain-containing protein